jgi:hypothetical protein
MTLYTTDYCIFQSKPATHSNRNPPLVLIQTRHPFQSKVGHLF